MNMFKKHSSLFSFLGLIAIVLITFSSLNPHFMAVNNMLKAFRALSITALAALGLTFVVAIGYSDMSFHFVSCFAAMAMSYCISLKMHPVLAIVLGLAAAAVFGVINGIAIGRFKLPDMIVTIGLGTAVYGLAYIFSGGAYIYRNFLKSGIMELNNGLIADIPLPVIFLIVIYFAAWLLLHRSIYGRRFYAIGGNELAAEYSGIKVRRYIIAAFIICAVLSAFPNMIQIAAQGKGYLKGGLTLLMPAWSAVFVGISIFKRPTVYGTFMGAFLVSIMQNGFTMLSVPFYYMDGVIAIVLMVSIAFSGVELSSLIKKDRKGGEKANVT